MTSTPSSGSTYYSYGGEAIAFGEDTLTVVDTSATVVSRGPVTTAKINIKAKAVAEGDSTYASTSTYVESNCDISVFLNFKEAKLNYDGVSYDISKAKFIGISLPEHVILPDGSIKIEKEKVIIVNEGQSSLDVALDGNVAALSFDAQVYGENTYLSAEVGVLAVEDSLSISAFQVTAVVV